MLRGSKFLAVFSVFKYRYLPEAFLLERNMRREMIGGYMFSVIHGALMHRSFLEVFLLERNMNMKML